MGVIELEVYCKVELEVAVVEDTVEMVKVVEIVVDYEVVVGCFEVVEIVVVIELFEIHFVEKVGLSLYSNSY